MKRQPKREDEFAVAYVGAALTAVGGATQPMDELTFNSLFQSAPAEAILSCKGCAFALPAMLENHPAARCLKPHDMPYCFDDNLQRDLIYIARRQ